MMLMDDERSVVPKGWDALDIAAFISVCVLLAFWGGRLIHYVRKRS